jgi:putative phosphoesterase
LISDTHGLLRPEALAALKGSELIIHAGDIGKSEVLSSLQALAPVLAIRGNNDRGRWAQGLPDILDLSINGVTVQIIHNVKELEDDLLARAVHAVISGHSHKPGIVERQQILFVNPGSAGPRRFKLPVAVGALRLSGRKISARIIELPICPVPELTFGRARGKKISYLLTRSREVGKGCYDETRSPLSVSF